MSAPDPKVPPDYRLTTPLAGPTVQVKSLAEFQALSPEAQAAAISQFFHATLSQTIPGPSATSGAHITVPSPSSAEDRDAWRGSQPSKEDIENLERGDWKR